MKRFKINLLMGICVALTISSCAVSKKHTRPELHLPDKYRQEVNLTADSVQLPWNTFFRNPQLTGLIEKALEKNKDISIALKNMEQLDLAFKQAKLGLLPTLEFVAGVNRNYNSKNSLNGQMADQFVGSDYMDDFNSSLRLNWEVDIWGKAAMQKAATRAEYFGQVENLSALKTRIIVQVAQAYYNLVSLDEQMKIAKENIALSDNTLQMIRFQYNAGQVNSLAVEQSEAQKKTAELLVPLIEQNIAVQENALSILCGSYPESVSRITALKNVALGDVFVSGVPAELISRRPDVKAAEYAVMALNEKTGLAKAAMYPSISLSPQIGTNSMKFRDWFDLPGSLTKTLAANLTAPIFQKRSLNTAYKTALIEQEKAAIQFEQSVLVAVREVSDALAKSKAAEERMLLVEQKSVSLDKAVEDAMKLYRAGMATYLEVITAQNNRLQNDLEAVNIEMEKLNAYVELYRALGGGVQ
ncbi:MAG: TolC family protein [Flavobacteriales bacterium]